MGFDLLDRFLNGQTHFLGFQAQKEPYFGVVSDEEELQGDDENYTSLCYDDEGFHGGAQEMVNQGSNRTFDCPKTCTRGRRGSSSTLVKIKWTDEEDRALAKLVKEYGMKKWACIANRLDRRSAKQCRERWQNHLRPDIKKDSWSEDEDKIFIEVHKKLGNRWSEIAKKIPGRTENAVKNHWNAAKRRRTQKARGKAPKPSSLLQDYIERNNSSNSSSKHIPTETETPPDDYLSWPLINENNCDEERVFMLNLFDAASYQPLGLLPPPPPLS